MKKYFLPFLFLFSIAIILVQSCDKIEGPFREEIGIDTSCTFSPSNAIVYRKVLTEDYTGHLCGNCPAAGVFLNDTLKAKYGDSLIIISVHAGGFADTCPTATTCPGDEPAGAFRSDYRNAVGTEWNTFFGIAGNPIALINRVGYPTSTQRKTKTQWDATIQSQLGTPALARLRIENTYDDATHKLRACIETKFLAYLSGTFKLQVILTEDSIFDWQEWYFHTPKYVPDFFHHHVLRASLNTTWGVPIISGSVAADSIIANGYFLNLNPNWNAAHCRVVAFVYNDVTKEILQVEEKRIK